MYRYYQMLPTWIQRAIGSVQVEKERMNAYRIESKSYRYKK